MVRLEAESDQNSKLHAQEPTWFPQKPYFLVPLSLLVIYSLIASGSPESLALADKVITSLVDSLYYIGLGVTKPFMDGPMPERYYANLVGIGVWGVVVYNIRTIAWYATRGVKLTDKTSKWERVRVKWGILGLGLTIAAAFLSIMLFASYLVLTLLNSIHGWFVFHVTDMITPVINVVVWVLPGTLITAFWWLIAWMLVKAFMAVYQSSRSISKGKNK